MSAELVPVPNTVELAALANAEHAEAERSLSDMLAHAWRSGHALTLAKRSLRHGEWLGWLADNFAGNQQTASEYVRLRANYADPRSLPSGVGVRAALTRASAENGGPKIRRVNTPEPDTTPENTTDLLRRLSTHEGLDALEAEPGFDRVALIELCEAIGQRLQARAQHADPCICERPAPDGEGDCYSCGRELPRLSVVA